MRNLVLCQFLVLVLIFALILTGFEIHSSFNLLGYEQAVVWHNYAAWAFIILIVFSIFWHFSTDEWKNYIPTTRNLKAQLNYYIFGIFKNAPHPTKKKVLSKLNPLQRIIGMSDRMFRISFTSLSPVILGIVRSVITKSNRSGFERNRSNASTGLVVDSAINAESAKGLLGTLALFALAVIAGLLVHNNWHRIQKVTKKKKRKKRILRI